jgi:hypothetical protein
MTRLYGWAPRGERLVDKVKGVRGYRHKRFGVDWCAESITLRFPNFRFHHIAVYNRFYNPNGKFEQSVYTFPLMTKRSTSLFWVQVFILAKISTRIAAVNETKIGADFGWSNITNF